MKETFINAQRWLGELRQYAEPDCVIILVGNKADLVMSNKSRRQVTYDEAKSFADENKLIFFETSALSNYKVNDCFEDLIQEIYNERRKVNNVNRPIPSNNIILKSGFNKNTKKDNSCFEC